jgi:hypothetical protein
MAETEPSNGAAACLPVPIELTRLAVTVQRASRAAGPGGIPLPYQNRIKTLCSEAIGVAD